MRCGLIPRLLDVSPQLEPPGAGDEGEAVCDAQKKVSAQVFFLAGGGGASGGAGGGEGGVSRSPRSYHDCTGFFGGVHPFGGFHA